MGKYDARGSTWAPLGARGSHASGADILDRTSNLTPLERAVIDKANGIKALKADGHLTALEASHQVWAIKDILIAVDPHSLVIERLYELEKEVLR
ncbi:hypothetical protein ACEUCF_02810 [Aeromonas veronii]